MLTYLKQCLKHEELLALEKADLQGGKAVELEHIMGGQLPAQAYKQFRDTAFMDEASGDILVILAPVVLVEKENKAKGKKYAQASFSPLYVPAWLASDGKLKMPREEEPWISRPFLRPNPSAKNPLWGELENYQLFIKFQGTLKNCDTWRRYIDKCARMLEESCLFTFTHVPPGFEVLGSKIIGIDHHIQRPFRSIYQLYEQLEEQNKHNVLLSGALGLDKKFKDMDETTLVAQRPRGVYDSNDHLSESEAKLVSLSSRGEGGGFLDYKSDKEDHESLLRSLVIEPWVNAAIERTAPPLIFFLSDEDNLTNLMFDVFPSKSAQGVDKRWLLDVKNLVTASLTPDYFVQNKARLGQHHLYFDEEHTFPALKGEEYLEKALPHYVHSAQQFLKSKGDLEACIDELHGLILKEVEDLQVCEEKYKQFQEAQGFITDESVGLLGAKENIYGRAEQRIAKAQGNIEAWGAYLKTEKESLSFVSKLRSKLSDTEIQEMTQNRTVFLNDIGIAVPPNQDVTDNELIEDMFKHNLKKLQSSLGRAKEQFERLEESLQVKDEWHETMGQYGLDAGGVIQRLSSIIGFGKRSLTW